MKFSEELELAITVIKDFEKRCFGSISMERTINALRRLKEREATEELGETGYQADRDCDTCKHQDCSTNREPCASCLTFCSNWESRNSTFEARDVDWSKK